MSSDLSVTYWGVTGSFANPLSPAELHGKLVASVAYLRDYGLLKNLSADKQSAEELGRFLAERLPFSVRSTYGGNTTCVEVQAGSTLLILDAGSGLRRLGIDVAHRWDSDPTAERRAHVLLTHSHMDHTFATPFCDPYYDPRNNISIWAPQAVLNSLHAVLSPASGLKSTYFPPTYELLRGVKDFKSIEPSAEFMIHDVEITTMPLRHPGGCIAYRIARGSSVFVFATDHEQIDPVDENLVEFARGADLLYMDAQYTEDEYHGRVGVAGGPPLARVGWGHSTIEGAVQTAIAAGVQRLHFGHHEPKRTDAGIAELESLAKSAAGSDVEVAAAHEGLTLRLP